MKFKLPKATQTRWYENPYKHLEKSHLAIWLFRVACLMLFIINITAMSGLITYGQDDSQRPNGYFAMATIACGLLIVMFVVGVVVSLTEWISNIEKVEPSINRMFIRMWIIVGGVFTVSCACWIQYLGPMTVPTVVFGLATIGVVTPATYYYNAAFKIDTSWKRMMREVAEQ